MPAVGRNAGRMTGFDCAVVGAGIHGLCTAFWLRQLGLRGIVVLEQFAADHARGSSHGASRITRSSYAEPEFVALAQRAHSFGWPALEQALGRSLRLATPGVFFGPLDGPFAAYRNATAAAGVAVTPVSVAEARDRFPLLRFGDDDGVLVDATAAVLLAATTMQALREWLIAHGVELRWQTQALAVRAQGRGLAIETPAGTVQARHAVLATGPWSGQLVAGGLPDLVVQRQTVGYFEVDAPPAATAAGRFPVWARIGRTAEEFVYGLPPTGSHALKLARHRTTGAGCDPEAAAPPHDAGALLALARAHLTCPVRGLAASETCLYTMAPAHRLFVHRDATLPVTTIAACSGHAFKFGPVIGREAADLVLADRPPIG